MLRAGKVVIVTAGGKASQILINAIKSEFQIVTVIEERPESKWRFMARRARKFGWTYAIGQFLTMVASRMGKLISFKRNKAIVEEYGVDPSRDLTIPRHKVRSINDVGSHHLIGKLEPDVIMCVSCRILSQETLLAFKCPVLNFHAGILPEYPGLLAGYWARIKKDDGRFGSTIHFVGQGVDTGAVLYRSYSRPDLRDTISTYPLVQTAAAVDIITRAVGDAISGNLAPEASAQKFEQCYHPPIWTYLKNGFTRNIW